MYRLFYDIKPFIHRRLQIALRRQIAKYKRKKYAHNWPIDPKSAKPPVAWPGWPGGKQFALVLSHDVDTKPGEKRVKDLAEMELERGFCSAFNFVPERYANQDGLKEYLRGNGFEINVHGLKHDGKLFKNRKIFDQRAEKINHYLKLWNTSGFTAPSMHHKSDWLHALSISYSISTFDTDPFEPQPDGVGTIFPFWFANGGFTGGYVELPYTLPQDHLVFVILRENNIDIWKRKLDWVAEKGGMALLNTHSDYMSFDGGKLGNEEYPVEYYIKFLEYLKSAHSGSYYHAVPSAIASFWKENIVHRMVP